MTGSEPPPWAQAIRRERLRNQLSVKRLALSLRANAEADGDSAPELDSMITAIRRWESGRNRPDERYRARLASALHATVEQMFGGPQRATNGSSDVVDSDEDMLRRRFLALLATGAGAFVGPAQLAALERELFVTARRVQDHASSLASHSLHPSTIDVLQEEVVRLAGRYWHTSPMLAYDSARRLYEIGLDLLTRTSRPGQQQDLHLAVGQACGLLASASFDLGARSSATELARSAWVVADHIGHSGLCAWAGGMEALIAYWSGKPVAAIDLAKRAQDQAPSGTAGLRLLCIEARAWSHVGDLDQVNRAVEAAVRMREQSHQADELHDGVGGEFGFDVARQSFCLGTAYLQVGAPREALQHTQLAIQLYENTPAERRPPAIESQAYADLATAYLMHNDFDGAQDALRPVLTLAPEYRIGGLIHRLNRVQDMLNRVPKGRAVEARQLGEQIQLFMAAAVRPSLQVGE
jgi:tetratricopeptide (TPR) repeat protein